MIRWKAAAAALAIGALALTGCAGGGDAGTDTSGEGGTLTVGALLAPVSMDPGLAEWGNRTYFYQAAYDTLLLADTDGEIKPFLATAWEYNEDQTVLTLTLRDDVTFTDGTDLTADVVVQNLERFKTGTSPDATYLTSMETATAVDEQTVEITLSAPDPAFLAYLTRTAGLVASAEAIDAGTLEDESAGSGPYIYDASATVAGSTYVYTKNEDYWNPELQHYDEIIVTVLSDPTAALNAIKAGEIDAIRLASNDVLGEVEASGWTVNASEQEFQGLLLLDRAGTMAPELADPLVRQAINFAFDRDAMLESLQLGYGTATTQVFPTRSAAYDDALDEYYTYDPDKARELLAEAGLEDGFSISMPRVTGAYQTTFTIIEQQLAEVGITVEYVDTEPTNFISDLLAPKFPASWMQLEQNTDWQLIQFMISPTALFNPFRSQDPVIDELLTTYQFGDEATRDESVAELNTYLVEQAWFAPFYRVQLSYVTDPATTAELVPTNSVPNIYDIFPTE
ncbi:ABC transporter substrate-binding protein [Microbacterium aoyamense]|uniref:ABC transporter substrate-binding protein n=1 Tax=Microbacterium aoyamense TaxID=344166 RepID=A0ABN2PMV9_9MICO|nr:ABC transporter substrate-binding protein [Microbacterium aoyamense]